MTKFTSQFYTGNVEELVAKIDEIIKSHNRRRPDIHRYCGFITLSTGKRLSIDVHHCHKHGYDVICCVINKEVSDDDYEKFNQLRNLVAQQLGCVEPIISGEFIHEVDGEYGISFSAITLLFYDLNAVQNVTFSGCKLDIMLMPPTYQNAEILQGGGSIWE